MAVGMRVPQVAGQSGVLEREGGPWAQPLGHRPAMQRATAQGVPRHGMPCNVSLPCEFTEGLLGRTVCCQKAWKVLEAED